MSEPLDSRLSVNTRSSREPNPRAANSALELLHPQGTVFSSQIIGNGCPPSLWVAESAPDASKFDLVIVAPDALENNANWLRQAVCQAAETVTPHGIIYVLVPRASRPRVAAMLIEQGLFMETPIVHVPDWKTSRLLLPLRPGPIDYTITYRLRLALLQERILRATLYIPGADRLLRHLPRDIALVARPPEASPLYAWLWDLYVGADTDGDVLLETSWRETDGAIILYVFTSSSFRPSAVAKVHSSLSGTGLQTDELTALRHLGPAAREAGADVPVPLWGGTHNAHTVTLLTPARGRTMASIVEAQPERVSACVMHVASWLLRWNRATVKYHFPTEQALYEDLLFPAAELAPTLPQGKSYLTWLERQCSHVAGQILGWTASHNDLTLSNILWDDRNGLAIIDWEQGRERGYPLADFWYMVVDAFMRASTPWNRPGAFHACFTVGGTHREWVTSLQQRMVASLGVSADTIVLAFHACWLHHAWNEHQMAAAGSERPFLAIVQELAMRHTEGLGAVAGDGDPGPNN